MRNEGARKGPRRIRWIFITSLVIGILFCLTGAAMMFFDIGPLPFRITLGILGIALISSSSPIATALRG
jgi:hypothetical protein